MYSVLLVDDEVLIREAIGTRIDWNELGMELVGSCSNGKEAIEFLQHEVPDLILADICMPYIDGIELAKYVHEYYPEVNVMIISGHDNFEYAKNAIKYQVVEYILKPITALELTEALVKVKEKLDKQHKALKEIQVLVREKVLQDLIKGKSNHKRLVRKLKEYNIGLEGDYFLAVLIQCRSSFQFQDNHLEQDEVVPFAVANVATEMLKSKKNCVVFRGETKEAVILLTGESRYHVEQRALEICKRVQEFIYSTLKIHTTIAMGYAVTSVEELAKSYEKAKDISGYDFLKGPDSILIEKDFSDTQANKSFQIELWEETLLEALKRKSPKELTTRISGLFHALRQNFAKREVAIIWVDGLARGLGNYAMEKLEDNLFLEKIKMLSYLEEIEEEMQQYCAMILLRYMAKSEGEKGLQGQRALVYIEENYRNPEVSLNTICSYLSMSTSHFSGMFKQYTGETFIEALTKKRIEKAKQLLEETNLRTYEIAEEIGYSDPHYFSNTFKKYVGKTPTEYGKKWR